MAGGAVRRTRFAPSPTGPLHLGHAFAALTAARLAGPGQFLLRIEDIDRSRCRPEWEAAIHEDLQQLAENLVQHLHLNPAKRYPQIFIEAAAQLHDVEIRSTWLDGQPVYQGP